MNRARGRLPPFPGRGPNRAAAPWRPSPSTTAQQARGPAVPSTRQVVPGASVFVVLKADQRSGRETAGTVQDVLTRGEHPRGIKVRLRDGRVGRVRRMADEAAAAESAPRPIDHGTEIGLSGPDTIQCPVCQVFEGDEAAVRHHVERDHFP